MSMCPCCMSMSMLHVHIHVHAAYLCVCVWGGGCVCVHAFVCVRILMFVCSCSCINAGMPDCPASDQSSTRMKKLVMPGPASKGPSLCSPAFFWSGTGLKLWILECWCPAKIIYMYTSYLNFRGHLVSFNTFCHEIL
jgi:hypothetical protein